MDDIQEIESTLVSKSSQKRKHVESAFNLQDTKTADHKLRIMFQCLALE